MASPRPLRHEAVLDFPHALCTLCLCQCDPRDPKMIQRILNRANTSQQPPIEVLETTSTTSLAMSHRLNDFCPITAPPSVVVAHGSATGIEVRAVRAGRWKRSLQSPKSITKDVNVTEGRKGQGRVRGQLATGRNVALKQEANETTYTCPQDFGIVGLTLFKCV